MKREDLGYPFNTRLPLTEDQELVKNDSSLPWWFRCDWLRTNKEIAAQVNISHIRVTERRRILGIPKPIEMSDIWLKWYGIVRNEENRALTDKEIALKYGASERTVAAWRARIAKAEKDYITQQKMSYTLTKDYKHTKKSTTSAARLTV